jgi:hypothetical protein
MGGSWSAFEKMVDAFDINNASMVKAYNSWIDQIRERYDWEYKKQPISFCSAKEIEALREHFNDIIENEGLIAAYQSPD